MRDILKSLIKLGLKAGEAKIYLVCFRAPRGLFTHEIVRETRLGRSTVDAMIERMRQQGWLSAVREGARLRYVAMPYEQVLDEWDSALGVLRTQLPSLSRPPVALHETEVFFYEGLPGIQRIFKEVLKQQRSVSEAERYFVNFSSGLDLVKIWPDSDTEFVQKRIRHKSKIYIISPATAARHRLYATDDKELRAMRYLTQTQSQFRIDIVIFGDYIGIISPFKPVSTILIKNGIIATALREIFWTLWAFLPAEAAKAKKR